MGHLASQLIGKVIIDSETRLSFKLNFRSSCNDLLGTAPTYTYMHRQSSGTGSEAQNDLKSVR